ncbi:MAG: zf-HC2 domain-containing protein [Planctomycetota bacterium]
MTTRPRPFADGPRPPACEEVAGALPLLHDHELGVAETAAVEAHLAVCSACQDEAEAYARLSSALKRLDAADMVVPLPSDRLARSVLARVGDTATWRRRQARTLRLARRAWAAAVVAALGGAVVLGATAGRDRLPDASRGAALADADVQAVASPAELALARLRATPSTVAAAPVGSPPILPGPIVPGPTLPERELREGPAWSRPAGAGAAPALLAELEHVRREVERRSRLQGEPIVAYALPGAGRGPAGPAGRADAGRAGVRYVPLRVLRQLEGSGLLAVLEDAARRRGVEVSSPTVAGPTGRMPTARPADLLAAALDEKAPHAGFPSVTGAGGLLDTRAWRTPHAGVEALDPLEAQARGQLAFAEEDGRGEDVVVALVGPTRAPILLLDGQLLVGGRFDRVVAEPVWLPASAERRPVVVPCRRVTWGAPRAGNAASPRLSTLVAGPSLRALLRDGADAVTILEHVQTLVQAADPVGYADRVRRGGSLVDAYDALQPWKGTGAARDSLTFREHALGAEADLARDLAAADIAGFEAVQRAPGLLGAWLGLEQVGLGGAARGRALARLWLGYELEGWLAWRAVLAAEQGGRMGVPARVPASVARDALRNAAAPLLARRDSEGEPGLARGEVETGLAAGRLGVLALPGTDASLVVSAVAPAWMR